MFLRKKHLKKAYLFLGLEHDPSPFRRQEHIGNVIFRILLQKVEIIPFWLPNRKIIKISHFWSKNDISAPMAPTLINVMVFLVFWDTFSSFSDFGGKFLNLSAKITFCAKKSQSRPKLLESCSWIFHFWTRKNLEGFFASEECKIWSFFALSAQNES